MKDVKSDEQFFGFKNERKKYMVAVNHSHLYDNIVRLHKTCKSIKYFIAFNGDILVTLVWFS